jgi:hypothetical protein
MNSPAKLVFLLVLCSIVPAAAGAPPASLTVRVIDETGASITDALVVIHPESRGAEPRSGSESSQQDRLTRLAPDATTATFHTDLPLGAYDVFVARAGFRPSCLKVHLLSNGETRTVEMKLTIDTYHKTPLQ